MSASFHLARLDVYMLGIREGFPLQTRITSGLQGVHLLVGKPSTPVLNEFNRAVRVLSTGRASTILGRPVTQNFNSDNDEGEYNPD